jgi:hypothetical protein
VAYDSAGKLVGIDICISMYPSPKKEGGAKNKAPDDKNGKHPSEKMFLHDCWWISKMIYPSKETQS